jgi:hypothetical protein
MLSDFGAWILAFHRVTRVTGRCSARGCRAISAPSRGTLRCTLTGPGAGDGSTVAAIRAPRSLAPADGRDRAGHGLGRTPSQMTGTRCPYDRILYQPAN